MRPIGPALFVVARDDRNAIKEKSLFMSASSASDANDRPLAWLPLCRDGCERQIMRLLWLVLLLLPVHQFYYYGAEITQWDALLFSGVLAFMLGLHLIGGLRERFENTVHRLINRGALRIDESQVAGLFIRIEQHAQYWARLGGILAFLAIGAAFFYVLAENFFWQRALLGVAEVFGAYVAGSYLGRMASYGQFGWQLQMDAIDIELLPDHVDGVAGLKPMGDYYFLQAMIAGIPAFFLALWWFAFPIWPRDYTYWEQPYIALLSVAIAIEILAFLVPIWSFHRLMQKAKLRWLEQADHLGNEILEFQQGIDSGKSGGKGAVVTEPQIAEMRRRYWAIEDMATWPVDMKTRKRFKMNNLLLLVPLIGDLAKRNVEWGQLLSFLQKFAA